MALKRKGTLKEKLERKALLQKEIEKVDDSIDEIVGTKKVKINIKK